MQRAARAALAALVLALSSPAAAQAPEPDGQAGNGQDLAWYGSLSGGQLTAEGFREVFIPPLDMEDHFMVAGSVIHELDRLGDFAVEAEGIGAWHWGPFRGVEEEYAEMVGAGNLRWKDMPWDQSVDTSLALGLGLSATTIVPEHEGRIHGKSAAVLTYMMLEATVARPTEPDYMLFVRIHHRSGAYGLMGDVRGASNYLTGGIRIRLD